MNYKNTTLINFLTNTFNGAFEDLQDNSSHFVDFTEFEVIIKKGFESLIEENIYGVAEALFRLYQHFLTPDTNVDLTKYCQAFSISQFCFFLLIKIKESEFLPITPYFLQLFIEILAKDKSNNFARYCIDYGAVEIIMYLKNVASEYYPLIMIFAYDLYNFCSDYIVKKTTEFYTLLEGVFNELNNEEYSFLSLLVLINLLRETQIENEKLNQHFFQKIIICIKSDSQDISISAMWCVYFWFQNSWENAFPFISEDFIETLSNNIKESKFEDIKKLSLYVYSFLWAISDDTKKSDVERYFPFEEVLSMIDYSKCSDDDTCTLCVVNLNNFICDKNSNFTYFLSNKGFELVLSALKCRSSKCKQEVGFLITTALDFIPENLIQSYINNDLIVDLCELCLLGNSDLMMKILKFFYQILLNFPCIIPILEENNFLDEVRATDDPKVNEMVNVLERNIQETINQHK